VDVIEIHQAIQQITVAFHRTGLPSPREGKVWTVAFAVARPESRYLPALAVQIAAQFAGDIQNARAAAVVALV
jgi:hypothetical protein